MTQPGESCASLTFMKTVWDHLSELWWNSMNGKLLSQTSCSIFDKYSPNHQWGCFQRPWFLPDREGEPGPWPWKGLGLFLKWVTRGTHARLTPILSPVLGQRLAITNLGISLYRNSSSKRCHSCFLFTAGFSIVRFLGYTKLLSSLLLWFKLEASWFSDGELSEWQKPIFPLRRLALWTRISQMYVTAVYFQSWNGIQLKAVETWGQARKLLCSNIRRRARTHYHDLKDHTKA